MAVNLNLGGYSPITQATTGTPAKETEEKKDTTGAAESAAASKSTGFSEAAVYEKSADADKYASAGSVTKKDTDRTAIIAQMKADSEERANQLLDLVRKTLQGQGQTAAQAGLVDSESMWKFLAEGKLEVDDETRAKAQEAIGEDGEFGVKQTSDRIVDFAKALAGNDPAQADKFIDAFKKGYEEATKTWGKDLPDISKQTYDAVMSKFDEWKNSANSGNTNTTNNNNDTAAQTRAAEAGASFNVTA